MIAGSRGIAIALVAPMIAGSHEIAIALHGFYQ